MNLRINLISIYNNMKTFLEISDNCIINTTKITTITKIENKVNFETKYCIRYCIGNDYHKDQYFDTEEERDLFFDDICNDLIYQ